MRASAEFVKTNLTGPIKAVEVGVGHGLNALDMLEGLNIEKLYLVDPYIAYSDDGNETVGKRWTASQSDLDFAKKNMMINLSKFSSKIVNVYKASPAAASDFADGSLDYVYIDSCHFVDNVTQDINAWWPKVKTGGVLAGHDYVDPPRMPDAVVPEESASVVEEVDPKTSISDLIASFDSETRDTIKIKLEGILEKISIAEMAANIEQPLEPVLEKTVEPIITDNHPGVTTSVDKFVADNGLTLQTGPAGQETDWFIQK